MFIVGTYKPHVLSGIKMVKIYIKHIEKIKPHTSFWEVVIFFFFFLSLAFDLSVTSRF